jgi:hydroxymethylglutaryl-CoA synthase
VAFLVSGSPVAVLQSRYLRSDSLLDSWRLAGDRFQHGWEDRFVTLHGFREPLLPLLREAGADVAVRHLALAAPDARAQRDLAVEVGLQDRLVPGLWSQVGHCGTALSALLLVAALERADPADGLLQADHGDGATVLYWRCVERAPRQVLSRALARRRRITDYHWYLKSRDLLPGEYPPVIDQGIPATVHFRERAEDLGLIGQRCECGSHQFPRGRICQRCEAVDSFVLQRYADAVGYVVTYTHDAFFPSPEPPTTAAIVQIEEGPRIHMQVADINSRDVVIGLPVRFVFRCIHRSGGKPNYFWKAVPADAGEEV